VEDYQAMRARLVAMRDELEQRLQHITRTIRHADEPPEKDFAEQVTERESDEVLDALGGAAREELSKIRRAIQRIDDGEYGECVVCGNPIAPERLQALPYSDMCINCAEKASRT
jgi:DnaK suppressor protein